MELIDQMIQMKDLQVFSDSEGYLLNSIFDCMQYAEEEIEAAQKKWPEHKEAIWNAFKYLKPGILLGASASLYRAHCREIVERIAKGQDLRLGTKAEVVRMLSDTSLRAPLLHDAAVLYIRLFQDMFPEAPELESPPLYESYEGATELLLATLRKKLTQEDRKFTQ